MKKIIITEKQMELIVNLVKENNTYDRLLGEIVDDLDLNYEPAMGTHEIGNEFYNTQMIGKKVDGSTISPEDLYKYFTHKYKNKINNPEFIKRAINDWYNGAFKNGERVLSKNVGFS